MEIGLGIDGRFALGADEQRAIAREAASLGYRSLWTPIGPTREPFDLCALWHEASGLETGVAVAPLSGWSSDQLASVAKDRKSTRLNSSHANISYAVFCLKKKKKTNKSL